MSFKDFAGPPAAKPETASPDAVPHPIRNVGMA
jgi:hypothetical protein